MEIPKNISSEFDPQSIELPISSLPKLPDKIDLDKITIPKLRALKRFIPKKLPTPPKFGKHRRR